MPRWPEPRLTPEQKKERKREYDQRRNAARRSEVRREQLVENSTKFDPLQQPATESDIEVPTHGLRIAYLPDCQVRQGVPVDHLAAYGNYIAAHQPDVILCIGDFGDFPSLSTYMKPGSLESWGQCYDTDVKATVAAMEVFMNPIARVVSAAWQPRLIFLKGNHEDRVDRAINENPRFLYNRINAEQDMQLAEFGWEVHPFLQPLVVGGVAFSHYFPSGVMGRPITTAAALLRKMHMSCIAGHLQGKDIAYAKRGDGSSLTGIISGSFYMHDESYLSPFTNKHWRGALYLHEVQDGHFDEMWLSIGYLLRRWG